MNIHSSLTNELLDKSYRDGFVASEISIGLPLQIRALRNARKWKQEDLAKEAGMSQPRIAEIEKPGKRRYNIETLLRLASAFDVALKVSFVPYGKVVDDSERFDPVSFYVPTFDEELKEAAEAVEVEKAWNKALKEMAIVAPNPSKSTQLLFSVPAEYQTNPYRVFVSGKPKKTVQQLKLPLASLYLAASGGSVKTYNQPPSALGTAEQLGLSA